MDSNDTRETRALQLRTQALGLMEQAAAIDGLKPYIVFHQHREGGSGYLAWSATPLDEDAAASVLDAEYEPERDESLTIEDNLTLQELTAVSIASRIEPTKVTVEITPALEWLGQFVDALDEMGFADPDDEVDGGDLVDMVNANWSNLKHHAKSSAVITDLVGALKAIGFGRNGEINGGDAVDCVGDHLPALRQALGRPEPQPQDEKSDKPVLTAPYPMTLAYIAIGAARELDSRGGLTDDQADRHSGEIGFFTDFVRKDWALKLDQAAVNRGDLSGVFEYEVAEPFGRRMAAAELDGEAVDVNAVIEELLDAAVR